MEPSIVPAVVVAVLVVVLGAAVLVALALDRPDPTETAVAYERAWDRLDFETLWRLSAPELRDGRTREEFVAAKRDRYRERADLAGLVRRVTVEAQQTAGRLAVVRTRLEMDGGRVFRNQLRLRRESGRWSVVAYRAENASANREDQRCRDDG